MEHKISEKKRYQLSRIILENTKKKRISSGNYYSVLREKLKWGDNLC